MEHDLVIWKAHMVELVFIGKHGVSTSVVYGSGGALL